MAKNAIDLRSDTVTSPTPEMRQAMASAEVGDDVLGDDPTVNELQREIAAYLGKETALFVPSGTMANQIAIRCHTQPGDEMLLDANAHIYWYEGGAPAALSGVTCRNLAGARGIFSVSDLRGALRPANVHFPRPRLLALENTHNRADRALCSPFRLRIPLVSAMPRPYSGQGAKEGRTKVRDAQGWSSGGSSVTICRCGGGDSPVAARRSHGACFPGGCLY